MEAHPMIISPRHGFWHPADEMNLFSWTLQCTRLCTLRCVMCFVYCASLNLPSKILPWNFLNTWVVPCQVWRGEGTQMWLLSLRGEHRHCKRRDGRATGCCVCSRGDAELCTEKSAEAPQRRQCQATYPSLCPHLSGITVLQLTF